MSAGDRPDAAPHESPAKRGRHAGTMQRQLPISGFLSGRPAGTKPAAPPAPPAPPRRAPEATVAEVSEMMAELTGKPLNRGTVRWLRALARDDRGAPQLRLLRDVLARLDGEPLEVGSAATFLRNCELWQRDPYARADLGERPARPGVRGALLCRQRLAGALLRAVTGNGGAYETVAAERLQAGWTPPSHFFAWRLWNEFRMQERVYAPRGLVEEEARRCGFEWADLAGGDRPAVVFHPDLPDEVTTSVMRAREVLVERLLDGAEALWPRAAEGEATAQHVADKALDEAQAAALRGALRLGVSAITGPAGCGKTLLSSVLIQCALDAARGEGAATVVCAAFTHKAAACLRERLKAFEEELKKERLRVCTVDSLIAQLEYEREQKAPSARARAGAADKPEPPCGPLYLLLDEASMVSLELLARLASAVLRSRRGYQLCFVGDGGQLRPIERGEMFRYLLERLPGERVAQLRKCYRAEHLDLYDALMAIRAGRLPQQNSEHFRFVHCEDAAGGTDHDAAIHARVDRAVARFGDTARYLVWRNEDVVRINAAVQAKLIRDGALDARGKYFEQRAYVRSGALEVRFYAGDRVVFNGNPYEGVTRAALGTVEAVLESNSRAVGIRVRWDHLAEPVEHRYDRDPAPPPAGAAAAGAAVPEDTPDPECPGPAAGARIENDAAAERDDNHMALMLAYCMTVHKAQGSEFPRVVVACLAVHSHLSMDDRRWLYTAASRAKEVAYVIGHLAQVRGFLQAPVRKRQTLAVKAECFGDLPPADDTDANARPAAGV